MSFAKLTLQNNLMYINQTSSILNKKWSMYQTVRDFNYSGRTLLVKPSVNVDKFGVIMIVRPHKWRVRISSNEAIIYD